MLPIPDSVSFPFRISICRVVRLHVSAISRALATVTIAICAFVPITWCEHSAAACAQSFWNNGEAVEHAALSFQKYSGVSVYPFSECARAVNGSDVQDPGRASWFVMFSDVAARYSSPSYQCRQFSDENFGTSYGDHGIALLGSVYASVSVEHAANEMMRVQARNERIGSERPKSVGQERGRYCYRDDVCARLLNLVFRANVFSEQPDVRSIFCSESEANTVSRRMPIGVQESEPISLPLRINSVKEMLVYRENSGSSHVDL